MGGCEGSGVEWEERGEGDCGERGRRGGGRGRDGEGWWWEREGGKGRQQQQPKQPQQSKQPEQLEQLQEPQQVRSGEGTGPRVLRLEPPQGPAREQRSVSNYSTLS